MSHSFLSASMAFLLFWYFFGTFLVQPGKNYASHGKVDKYGISIIVRRWINYASIIVGGPQGFAGRKGRISSKGPKAESETARPSPVLSVLCSTESTEREIAFARRRHMRHLSYLFGTNMRKFLFDALPLRVFPVDVISQKSIYLLN